MNGFPMKLSSSRILVLALAVLAWTGPAAAFEEDEHSIRWTNGLRTQDLRFNAISTNQSGNLRIVQVPLRTETFQLGAMGDPVLREQLADPSARTFLRYMVQCALQPGQVVSWTDRGGTTYQFEGRLGLCPAWHTGAPSPQCQTEVSACVLARNNPDGDRVLFSGRGHRPVDPTAFTPKAEVKTDLFATLTHNRVASSVPCTVTEYGIHRNCGFRAERVGRCMPGARVQVGAGGRPPDRTCGGATLGATLSGTMMLRVCEGLAACNEAKALAQSDGTCGTYQPAVSFTCPASGTFNVLSGAYTSGAPGEVEVAVQNAVYPATEQQIFPLREGAFFGNLFGPGSLPPGVHVYVDDTGQLHKDVNNINVAGSIYQKMYACMAPTWSSTAAYATQRLCTMTGTNCVAKPLGSCDAVLPSGPFAGQQRCQLENASGYGEYTQCAGTVGDLYPLAVTPYLNVACGIVKDPAACAPESGAPGGLP